MRGRNRVNQDTPWLSPLLGLGLGLIVALGVRVARASSPVVWRLEAGRLYRMVWLFSPKVPRDPVAFIFASGLPGPVRGTEVQGRIVRFELEPRVSFSAALGTRIEAGGTVAELLELRPLGGQYA